MASDKRKYVTSDQKAILVDFIRTNTRMVKHKFDGSFSFTVKECNSLWEQLAANLNSVDGARKSAREWRKCWHDLRRNTKEKVAKLKKQRSKICQGSTLQEDLTPIQEKVIGIIEGQESAPESMFMHDIKQEHNDNMNFTGCSGFKLEDYEQPVAVTEIPEPTPAPELFENVTNEPIPAASSPKRVVKGGRAVKRLKSIAEKKLIIKKSYYDQKLALLERHIQAIDRQTDAINKQTVVHEKLMQLLSRK